MSFNHQKRRIVSSIHEVTIGPKRLTKYEKSRVIGARALQLSMGAPPLIDLSKYPNLLRDPLSIAEEELRRGVLPITIRRRLPNGEEELIPIRVFITHNTQS